ncbi:MAG: YncE family protein [Gemmatimonadota bacterium]
MNLNRLTTWRWGAGALLAGIAVLLACDGSNLFDNEQNPFLTPRVSLSAPAGAFAGDTIGIAVSATSAVNVTSIDVSVRGAVSKDTTVAVSPARSVSAVVKIGVPEILTDTLIFAAAVAKDQNGGVSRVQVDTIRVVGPPVVSVDRLDTLALGATSSLTIRAFGSRRVAQLDVSLRGAVVEDRTIVVSPPLNDAIVPLSVQIPAVASDTVLRVGIVARDVSGLSSSPVSVLVPLRIAAPTATLTVPLTATPGSNLDLAVRGLAMRGVAQIRVELRGATLTPIDVETAFPDPLRTDLTQNFSIPLPGDLTDPSLTVRAFVIDRAGTVSTATTTATATVAVATGAPTILSVTAPDSTRGGQTVDVRVVAQGVRPITSLTVRFRGAVNQDVRVPITGRTSVTEDVSIQLPVEVADTVLVVTAVAEDQSGALSALTTAATRRIRVTDVTIPTVSATATPGSTAAGSTIRIRVNARDNVSVTRIGYAVVNPKGDTIGVTPTLVTTSGAVKDTTFSFIVPLTITPRTVRVLGIAQDASGRRGISTAVSVIVADTAAPAITINLPTTGSTLPLNDSVRVNVRVVDPTGVKTIRMRGESVSVDSLGPTLTIQRFAEKVITFPFTPGAPLPTDTTITRYLLAIPDSISEPVSIIVSAFDSINNLASVSTSILVGGPRVELRNPISNAQVVPGGTLLLTAFAVDRAAGIDSLQISLTGAQQSTFIFRPGCAPATCTPGGLASNDSVLVNQNYVVGPATGGVNIQATAWNRNRVAGQSAIASVLVTTTAVTDASPPQVRVTMTANDRVELSDTVTLDLAAQDAGASGLRRIGVVVIAQPGGTGVARDTLYLDSVFIGTGRTGLQPAQFKFTLDEFDCTETNIISMPRNFTFQVHAFAVDTVGNCGSSVTSTLTALPCDSIMPPLSQRKFFIARNTAPLSQLVTAVPGFARPLPTAGSVIADLVVDNNPARPRMYMANHNFNRVEVLNLQDSTFAPAVSVGSEPWGMFVNNANDRLMVANSGGTNISMVDITQPVNAIKEVAAERILTPNAVLFDVLTAVNNGFVRYNATAHDFSDRPQFVAQDANGIILHSTKPTGAAPDGTVRYLLPTAPRRESKILFNRNAISANNDATAIGHVDSVVVQRNSTSNDLVNIFDHQSGNPAAIIQSGFVDLRTAIDRVRRGPDGILGTFDDSDIVDFGGAWNLEAVGLSDTTFLAASGDGQFVAFGEGATGPFARVWVWAAASRSISDDISVTDLVGNSAERVLGVALNRNGLIGAARGAASTYFFSNDANFEGQLRLQGVFSSGVAGGNGGVALHPSHNTAFGSNDTTLAFIATVNRSIKIVDTFSFRERGEILIRDNIVGPLRAALPLTAENAGLNGTCNQIWVKLYGVTAAGKAVIINVRVRDIKVATPGGLVCPT